MTSAAPLSLRGAAKHPGAVQDVTPVTGQPTGGASVPTPPPGAPVPVEPPVMGGQQAAAGHDPYAPSSYRCQVKAPKMT